MTEFFKPWRRKFGALTLILAVLFMGGWGRSLVLIDRIIFHDFTGSRIEEHAVAGFQTQKHSLIILANELVKFTATYTSLNTATNSMNISLVPKQSEGESKDDSDHAVPPVVQPIVTGVSDYEMLMPVPLLTIPFWSVTIPLTLLSMYLLLSKPCKSNPIKITEPIPEDLT